MKPASPPAVLRVALPSAARTQPLSRPAPAAPGGTGAATTAMAARATPAPGARGSHRPDGNGSVLPRAGVLRHHGASGQLALELRRR
jgi:hypothetical protein